MILRPTSLRVANAVVTAHHRHNRPVKVGYKFALAAYDDTGTEILGVAIVGRPIAIRLDDGLTAEVLRLCAVHEAPRNTRSFLYGAAKRAWQAQGGRKILTYTLLEEGGASLRSAGWTEETRTAGGVSWADRTARDGKPREEQAISLVKKVRWASECEPVKAG